MRGVTLPADNSLLRARDVSVTLPGDDGPVRVLDHVSVDLGRGEVVDVVGESGSGKSTLARALAQLIPGASAELALDGADSRSMTAQRWRSLVTLVPQKPVVTGGSVRDDLLLPWRLKVRHGAAAPGDAVLREALDEVRLGDVALDRETVRLSVGQQSRVALLRAVLATPRVLLLDEADAALDEASVEAVSAVVAAFAGRGGAVLRVRHRADDGLAGRRLLMAGGSLTEVAR